MCRVQSPAMIPTNTNEQKGTVMLDEFMKTIGDFVFAEDIPEKADIIFIPGRQRDFPALLVELKYDKAAEGAIKQIKDKMDTQRYDKICG